LDEKWHASNGLLIGWQTHGENNAGSRSHETNEERTADFGFRNARSGWLALAKSLEVFEVVPFT
jgi:hypothetical protein